MKNLLVFDLTVDFGEDIHIVANNERDLTDYLETNHSFKAINFRDLDSSYGTCEFKNSLGYRESGQCFYVKYIS